MSEQLSIPVDQSQQPEEAPKKDLLPAIQNILNVIEYAKEQLPLMEKASNKAIEYMREIPDEIQDDEGREDAIEVGGIVADAHTKINERRMNITRPIDELKDFLMTYERPLDGKNENSEYGKLRKKIARYDQKVIDKKKEVEAQAAKQRAKKDALIDMGAAVLKNLSELSLNKAREAESQSKDYFAKTTLESWDKRVDAYMKMKPKLKVEDYDKCFNVFYNPNYFTQAEFIDFVTTLKTVETYDKWNEEVVKSCTPIVNAWRAKIPQLKEDLILLKNASDEEERQRIATEQQSKAKEEENRRLANIEQSHISASLAIDSQAGLDKIGNSFQEQAIVQQTPDPGPTKLVIKFTDQTKAPKAFLTIIAQCLASPKFPGFQKRTGKDKKLATDDRGNAVYIDAVQWWLDFFVKECDAAVEGTIVEEQAKVIIHKNTLL